MKEGCISLFITLDLIFSKRMSDVKSMPEQRV